MDDETDEEFSYYEEISQSKELNKVVLTAYDVELEIENCLTKKLSLKETVFEIENKFCCKLSDQDHCLVENKYVDFIIRFWMDEGLQNVANGFDPNFPAKSIDVLNTINNFEDCFKIYGTSSAYNDLIKELAKKSLTLKSKEKLSIREFKSICIAEILKKTHYAKDEITFLQMFEEVLKYTKNFDQICQSLQLYDFLENKLTFEIILENVKKNHVFCPKLNRLQRSAYKIANNDKFLFVNDLKEMVSAYLKPIEIKETFVDGRFLLEVSGKRIILSKELEEIEKIPRFCFIEEVRFIRFSILYIDADLSNPVWHGKNIAVFGKTLIVSEDKFIIWDVSGKDADLKAITLAGTSIDVDGLKGKDGFPGESGGNIYILVESIENSLNLNIISNGGKGSRGENGRPGKKGENGHYIDDWEFQNDFPPVSNFFFKERLYHKTIDSVSQNLCSVDKFLYGQTVLNVTKTDFKDFAKRNTELNSIYFEATTKKGCKITFSFYNENDFSCCQSFLLYKGSLGKPGEIGGAGGLGGKGGFAGDIQIKAFKGLDTPIVNDSKNGEDGKNGVQGKTGDPGKSGLDRGYMDCTLAPIFNLIKSEKWPKLFMPSPRDSNKLTVNYHFEKKDNTVKCPFNGLYAEINVIKRNEQTVQSFQVAENCISTQNDQHQESQVLRKKSIARSAFEQYKTNDSLWSMSKTMDSLDQAQLMMEELFSEAIHRNEEIIQALRVTKQLTYSEPDWYLDKTACGTYSTNIINNKEENDLPIKLKESEIKTLLNIKSMFNSITILKNKMKSLVSRQQFSSDLIQSSKVSTDNTEKSSLSFFLLDALNRIDLPCCERLLKNSSNIYFPCNVRFLGIVKHSINNVPQEPYSLVERFFFEDSMNYRQELVKICKDYSFNKEHLLEVINLFVLEFEDDSNFETDEVKCIHELKKCHHYSSFEKEFKLKEKLFLLKTELLSNNENKHLYNHLLDSTLKQSFESKIQFENKVQQDKFLSFLYRKFVEESKINYFWQHLSPQSFIDKILSIFNKFFIVKGPFAASCREFLSYKYGVNILQYTLDESNTMVLRNNHNPWASSKIHILLEKNTFYKLNFDHYYARLIERHSNLGVELNKIMFHLSSFADKQKIRDFYSESPFNSKNYSGVTKSEIVKIKVNHAINQDSNMKTLAEAFKSQEDIALIKSRLEKLKAEFSGNENILHYMALHFEVEENLMTVKEFCFVINQILKFSIEESQIMTVVSWKIAAKPQRFWIFELALLKLELYCRRQLEDELKLRWRKYIEHETEKPRLMMFLNKLDQETCPLSVEDIDHLLYLMSNVPKAHIGLEDVNINDWKYHLKDRFWAHQMKSVANFSQEDLKTLSYYLLSWENSVGPNRCEVLVNLLKKHAAKTKKSIDKKFVFSILRGLLFKFLA